MKPRISVLMTVHNGIENYPPGTLHRAIYSTLENEGVKLIVCDDGSEDETPEIIKSLFFEYQYPYQKLFVESNKLRQGAAVGYQLAAKLNSELVNSQYCILQSCRSWYEPGALKMMADYLDSHPEIGFVYGCTKYHGASERKHTPPPFIKDRFYHNFDSLFGYMYRREALEKCAYASYFEREGRAIDICDYDFVMQLIERMGYTGYAMRDQLVLNYYYSGQGQMTNLVHKYQQEINEEFRRRWPQK
jgi:glycosyltransferase involved in cell wall biosynthesis